MLIWGDRIMKYLGLDLGTKTLGVSITDKTNTLVSPYKLITFHKENYQEALNELMKIITNENITEVVLGLPKNMDNSLGFAAKRSLDFKNMLIERGIVVHLEDERLTSTEAINILKQNGNKKINQQKKTDVLAAVLILEAFLKRNK